MANLPPRRPTKRGVQMLGEPRVRRGVVRVASEVATRLRHGHPYLFRDALGARALPNAAGELVEILDTTGEFVAKGIYDPIGNVAVRVVTRNPDGKFDAETIRRRVETARRLREQLSPTDGTDTYRIIHTEGDGIPGVTVDKYGEFLVVHLYSPAIEALRTRSTTRSRPCGSRARSTSRSVTSRRRARVRAGRRSWRAARSLPSRSRSTRAAASSSST